MSDEAKAAEGASPQEPKDMGPADIGEAFKQFMGVDTDDSRVGPDQTEANEFFRKFEGAGSGEAPDSGGSGKAGSGEKAGASEAFVHPPTGKEFGSEEELIRYENGWKSNKISELEKQLERLSGRMDERDKQPQGESPQQPDARAIKKQLFPNLSDDDLDDPIVETMYQGLDRVAGMMQQQATQREQALLAQIEELKGGFEETRARQEHGIDSDTEKKMQDFLQKNPVLGEAFKGASPAKRVAMMAELKSVVGGGLGGSAGQQAKAVPTPRASDHVEGSAMSAPAGTEDLDKDFEKLDLRDMGSVLGSIFAKNPGIVGAD